MDANKARLAGLLLHQGKSGLRSRGKTAKHNPIKAQSTCYHGGIVSKGRSAFPLVTGWRV